MNKEIYSLDLTQRPPRSFKARLGDLVILPRLLDKGRATINGKSGEYEYFTSMDQHLVDFLNFDPDELLKELATGKGDWEMLEWVRNHSKTPRASWEIEVWSAHMERRGPNSDPETMK
jgi:hypothetical protein